MKIKKFIINNLDEQTKEFLIKNVIIVKNIIL